MHKSIVVPGPPGAGDSGDLPGDVILETVTNMLQSRLSPRRAGHYFCVHPGVHPRPSPRPLAPGTMFEVPTYSLALRGRDRLSIL